ncbi:cupin [Allohahella marinimesophila]|uniref:Acireductone dioxygenase n=1 Tax=Allohahella marinimesophila TaxID=1054972 RepID=A0ABP7PS86_9GAMM
MSKLWIFEVRDEDTAVTSASVETSDGSDIASQLADIGIAFTRWEARDLPQGATPDDVLAIYHDDIERFKAQKGFTTADVIALTPEHPQKTEMRKKFLDEHKHSEDEIRFFLRGHGLFYIRHADRVYAILCERNDLISVPHGTTHWFDMGPEPEFMALRLFTNTEGWVADFTGDPIATRIPRYEALMQ